MDNKVVLVSSRHVQIYSTLNFSYGKQGNVFSKYGEGMCLFYFPIEMMNLDTFSESNVLVCLGPQTLPLPAIAVVS